MLRKPPRAKKPKEFEMIDARCYGQVGAGTVVPFIPKDELVPVVVPKGTPQNIVGTMIVSGRSLSDLHICDGDLLIFRSRFSLREITPQTVCIVYIRSTGELCAKKVIKEATMITLRASGGGIKDIQVTPDDIEIQGLVFAFQRPVSG